MDEPKYCHFYEMDDYPKALKKLGKSKSVLNDELYKRGYS